MSMKNRSKELTIEDQTGSPQALSNELGSSNHQSTFGSPNRKEVVHTVKRYKGIGNNSKLNLLGNRAELPTGGFTRPSDLLDSNRREGAETLALGAQSSAKLTPKLHSQLESKMVRGGTHSYR